MFLEITQSFSYKKRVLLCHLVMREAESIMANSDQGHPIPCKLYIPGEKISKLELYNPPSQSLNINIKLPDYLSKYRLRQKGWLEFSPFCRVCISVGKI